LLISDMGYKKFRDEKAFETFIDNLDSLKLLDHHISPQINSLNFFNCEHIIKIESDLENLKKDFPCLDLEKKYNKSNSDRLISFLNKELESKIYEIYKEDYSLGEYSPIF
jgi:hypothetical protein